MMKIIRTPLSALALLACAVTLTGCLSRPALEPQTFSFGAPALTTTNLIAGGPVLGIKKVEVAAPGEQRSLVYRTGAFAYARDPYATFLDAPEQELVVPLRAGLCSQGDFSALVETGSALKPEILVEINVSQLYGDFRQPDRPKAVLTMRFTFYAATNGIVARTLFQKEYAQSIAIDKPSAAALMAGWNQALIETVGEVLSDYRQSRKVDSKE
jgi:uncharacterized lipoprotein YmbA